MPTFSDEAGLNVLVDTPDNDNLYGLGGNDTLTVTFGRDYVNGGADDDTIVIQWSDETKSVFVGTGFAFVDSPAGTDFANSLRKVEFEQIEHLKVFAGSGNDALTGIAFATDTLDGGPGADTWTDNFTGVKGDIKIDMSLGGGIILPDGSVAANMEQAYYLGLGDGNDSFRDYRVVGGSSFDDQVYGGAGNDSIGTSTGRDYFDGQSGTDTLVVNWVGFREDSYTSGPSGFGYAFTGGDSTFFATSTRRVEFYNFERLDYTGGDGDDTVAGFANVADKVDGQRGANRWLDDFSAFTGDLDVNLDGPGGFHNLADGSTFINIQTVGLMLGGGNDRFRDISFQSAGLGAYDDTVRSGSGDDDLGSSDGRDFFTGGDGTDTVRINYQSSLLSAVVDAPGGRAFVVNGADKDFATSTRRVDFHGFERLEAVGSTEADSFRGFFDAPDTLNGGAGADLWIDDFSGFKGRLNVDLGEAADGFAGLTLADGTKLLQIDRVDLKLGLGSDRFRDKRDLDDHVQGFDGNDSLGTTGGKDSFEGGAGDDTVVIDWSNAFAKCTVDGLSGQAFVAGGAGTFEASTRRVAFSGVEHLDVKGGARSDLFVGTLGRDTFDGSNGSDAVDYSARSVSVEVDLKFAAFVEVRLGGKVEDRIKDVEYVTGGSAGDRLTGDLSDNALTGNGGADTLDGGEGGSDLLTGGAGDDTYVIRSLGDRAVEKEGEGTDTVRSFVSFSLADGFAETLVLSGGGAINGTGNGLANTITGNAGRNVLSGLDGSDTVAGGAGDDRIDGGKDGDRLTGGKGADDIHAGIDAATDTIVFARGDSGTTARTWDQVFDFQPDTIAAIGQRLAGADLIDLSALDADPGRGHQQLRFVSSFTKAGKGEADGQLRVVDAGRNVNVQIDLDGNNKADMIIEVVKVAALTQDDFLL